MADVQQFVGYTEGNILQLISKYRSELMGMAITGVLIGHLLLYSENPIPIVDFFIRIIHTQGFLFLSGFGLYYSFSNNSDIIYFYKKRLMRLYVPYLIMAIPFFGLIVVAKDENFFQFIAYLLALDFWYLGNAYGMWYISVSIFLYFLYPYLHEYIFKVESGAEVVKRGCFTIITFVVVFLFVQVFVPSYWEIVSFGIGKTTIFPVGMIAGYFAKHYQKVSNKYLIMYLSLMTVLLIVFKVLDKNFYEQIRTLIGIPVFTLFLNFVDRNQSLSIINKVLRWLGTYSLEIYILHLFIWSGLGLLTTFSSTVRIILAILITLAICQPLHAGIDKIKMK